MRVADPRHAGREGGLSLPRRPGLDGAVVPGLLLLVARDLLLHDPPRALAWRLAHDERLAEKAAWLGPLLPAPSAGLDRDPLALLLSALAVLLALAYAAAAACGARAAVRAALIAAAALALVVLPSIGFMAMGSATDRPYGQDGGVVQLPLALDKILAGDSPYASDYSGTILARQARVSSFWDEWGGNPILRHHAYLPGTHLVMMPFHLVSRALFGGFDPRAVTLVFYVAVALLAWRLPASPEAKLAAAGVAALNPLVYWHQIFGANDLVFVAMLLGAVLLARSGRAVAAGALLGLACATKQLAWPFAPFLLLALSGARGWRGLIDRGTLRALARPALAAAAVFAAVVLPVAALDFRAFWSDIVAYNVGLPGADNYPLGGTPGFGVGNFLIYFGRVASLKDDFPFSVFYLLLVPLGLLLAHAQLRSGRLEWALATGSVALVASVYFSRVAHPNYLIPAAVLLPLAVLACRRGADIALVPLLLLLFAVSTTENELLRTTWEQGAALPRHLGGLAAALAPRAPQLTRDPLGLLLGATAAGLGVAYLAVGVGGLHRGARLPLVLAAAVLAVALPAHVVVRVGERTGIVRAQDPAVVQAAADATRLLAARSPYTPPPAETPRGRQLVSQSFRGDPPAELLPERPLLPPGPALAAAIARLAGQRDPRAVFVLALGLLAAVLAATTRGRRRRALVSVALLATPLALGTLLGSPVALALVALAGCWAAGRAGRPLAAGVLAGLAVAFEHRALLPALPLLLALRPRVRALAGALCACAAIVLPVALLDPGAFLARVRALDVPGPGLGVFNLLAYRGAEGSAASVALAALAPLLALALVLALVRRCSASPLTVAAVAALAGLALAPALSAEAVATPLLLLAMAEAEPHAD